MKRNVLISVFSLALILSLGGFELVVACASNPYTPPVCEMYGKSKAVFVGKVTGITELKKENTNSDFRIDFQVREAFLGVKDLTRVSVVLSGARIEYCGFETGKIFLVYAYKGSNGFSIDAGTRTRPITEAGEDLEFLRNLSKVKKGVRIYGTIMQAVKSSLEEDNKDPVRGMQLRLENINEKSRIFYGATDEDGNYELKGIPGGKYKISPARPLVGYDLSPEVGFGQVDVNDKGCVGYNFTLTTNNKFIGKVIDAEGKPVSHTYVEILSVNAKRPNGYIGKEYTNTNSDGTFYAYNITPGLYTLSVNYSNPPSDRTPFPTVFYPGVKDRSQAAIVEIRTGEEISDFEFRLPHPLEQRIIKGSVVWADGTPAVRVEVHLKDRDYDSCCINTGVKTDEQGNFLQIGYQDRSYRIWASGNRTDSSKNESYGVSSSFSADNAKPQIIVLTMTREQFERDFDGDDHKELRSVP
jgi:hypothetical protein